MLRDHESPTTTDIQEAFQLYQESRQARVKLMVKLSGVATRNNSLATLYHTIRFLYQELPSEKVLTGMLTTDWSTLSADKCKDSQTLLCASAPWLSFLSVPQLVLEHEAWNVEPADLMDDKSVSNLSCS